MWVGGEGCICYNIVTMQSLTVNISRNVPNILAFKQIVCIAVLHFFFLSVIYVFFWHSNKFLQCGTLFLIIHQSSINKIPLCAFGHSFVFWCFTTKKKKNWAYVHSLAWKDKSRQRDFLITYVQSDAGSSAIQSPLLLWKGSIINVILIGRYTMAILVNELKNQFLFHQSENFQSSWIR